MRSEGIVSNEVDQEISFSPYAVVNVLDRLFD